MRKIIFLDRFPPATSAKGLNGEPPAEVPSVPPPVPTTTDPPQGTALPVRTSTTALATVERMLDEAERQSPAMLPLDSAFDRGAAIAAVPDGRAIVLHHERCRFLERFEPWKTKLEGFLEPMLANLGALTESFDRLQRQLDSTARYLEVPADGVPWTVWDRGKCLAIVLLSLLFILVDMNSVATTLMESGLASFRSPVRAWFFSAAPVGLALGLKLLRDWLNPKPDRQIHAVGLIALGLLFGLLWLKLFADTFPGLTQSPTDIVNSLSLAAPADAGRGPGGSWLIFSGLAAAAFIAAAALATVESIIDSHRLAHRVDNPAFLKTQADLNRLRPTLERQTVLVRRAQGLLDRIAKGLEDHLAAAEVLYADAEAALRFTRDAYLRIYPPARDAANPPESLNRWSSPKPSA